MILNGPYYTQKKKEYDTELQQCIEKTCDIAMSRVSGADQSDHPIMLLGKVQSGKTKAFSGVAALAMDNNFEIVVILTKNSSALVSQTISRMGREFKHFLGTSTKEGSILINDIMQLGTKLSKDQKNSQNIIVVKKEKANLPKIVKLLQDYGSAPSKEGEPDKCCLIIDDEADVTGVGYARKPGTDEFTFRAISSQVNTLRTAMKCAFLQVTATPYSLYLQPDFDPDGPALPVKPLETVLVPHGDDYIGGEYYFIDSQDDNHPASHLFSPVTEDECDLVSTNVSKKSGKKTSSKKGSRRLKADDILKNPQLLPAFKDSLISFLLGVVYFRGFRKDLDEKGELLYEKAKFAIVFHTSTETEQHSYLQNLVQVFLTKITEGEEPDLVKGMLVASYESLSLSVAAHGHTMPSFDEMEVEFYKLLQAEQWTVLAVNGKPLANAQNTKDDANQSIKIDNESGDLILPSAASILVGGQILDRGITIPNMLGFYYTRNPETKQQDAMLQHSRMFGYRKHLLPVTRFYTTHSLHDIMKRFTEFDMALRDDIALGKQGHGVYFIKGEPPGTSDVSMVSCAADKVLASDFAVLRPGKRFLPVGFTPKPESDYEKASTTINTILGNEEKKSVQKVTIDRAVELIQAAYSSFEKDEDSASTKGRATLGYETELSMITNLRYLMENLTELTVVVVRGKATNKYHGQNNLLSNSPDSQSDSATVSQNNSDAPVLLLLEQTKQKSWDDKAFWWPVLVAQKKVKTTFYSKPDSIRIVHL